MCLFPRKVVTPYNRLSLHGGQPLYIDAPCGKCAECRKNNRLLWHFRTFHHCDDCVKRGGFIIYDTLTYAPEYLPMLSHNVDFDITEYGINDFSCFNHEHFRLFLKRMRRSLDYHFRGVKFDYFLTSEYGCDERFTHRPHYHVLFFVYPNDNGNIIDPLHFSRMVSKLWYFGRTDGIPYQPAEYVRKNVFASANFGSYNTNLLRVCNYVSKYINKDSDFQKQIDSRIALLSKVLSDEELLKKLIRNISMFHRQSQGFGLSYLNNLSNDEYRHIYFNGSCRICDPDRVILEIPLPLYYKRKLFYKCIKVDGKIYWIPNSEGLSYLRDSMHRNIQTSILKLEQDIKNCPDDVQDRIVRCLNGRPLSELAIYNLYYRNRTISLDNIHQLLTAPHTSHLNIKDSTLIERFENVIMSKYVMTDTSYYERIRETNTLYVPCLSDLFTTDSLPYTLIINRLIYDQNSSPHFSRFDEINNLITSTHKPINESKQRADEHLEQIKKRFKYLYKL